MTDTKKNDKKKSKDTKKKKDDATQTIKTEKKDDGILKGTDLKTMDEDIEEDFQSFNSRLANKL